MCRNYQTGDRFLGLFLWAFTPQNRRPFLGFFFRDSTRQEKIVVNHRKTNGEGLSGLPPVKSYLPK